jgi:hypothetical protein
VAAIVAEDRDRKVEAERRTSRFENELEKVNGTEGAFGVICLGAHSLQREDHRGDYTRFGA